MNLVYPLIISSIAGLSTILGTIFIFFKTNKKIENKFITFCLSISLIIMIYISIFDLIPNGLIGLIKDHTFIYTLLIFIISFTLGIILTGIIDKLSHNENNLYHLGIISMIALMLHNIPEGIITFITSINNHELGLKIAISIMFHNIPEGICIAVPIFFSTKSYFKAISYTLISGLSEPIGGLLFYLIFKNIITPTIINIIVILVSGIMISLAINKIYPEAKKYYENKYMGLGFIIGIIFTIILHIFC